MSTLEGKVIRLACNQSASSPTLDTLTGEAPLLWRGAGARLQCALFVDDPTADTIVTDISNIVEAELLVRKFNAQGTVLIDKTLTADDIGACTWDAWVDLSDQHFQFTLSDLDTSHVVPSSGTLPVYFAVRVMTAISDYIAAQGYATLVDVGIVDIGAPPDPTLFPVYTGGASVLDGDAVVYDGVSGRLIRAATGLEKFSFEDDGVAFRPWWDAPNETWARKVEPKVYRALISQTGTSAPVATVLENDFSAPIVWTRGGPGGYIGTLAGAFTANKTFLPSPSNSNAGLDLFVLARIDVDTVNLTSFEEGDQLDGLLLNTSVEIAVYP